MAKPDEPQPYYSDEQIEALRRMFEPQLLTAAAVILAGPGKLSPADAANLAVDLMEELLAELAELEES